MFAIAFGFIGAGVALGIQQTLRLPRRMREVSITQVLFVGFLALFFADATVRWTERTWYFVSFELFVTIFVVVVANGLFSRISHKFLVAMTLVFLILFSFYVDWHKNLRDNFGGQDQMYAAAVWMNTNLPAGSRIGVFNAGIQEYFSTQTVVDLDGLVNNDAAEALRLKSLWLYMRTDHIEYVADFDEYIRYRYLSFLGLSDPLNHLRLLYNIQDATTSQKTMTGLNIYAVQ